jgi:hypothetical protein
VRDEACERGGLGTGVYPGHATFSSNYGSAAGSARTYRLVYEDHDPSRSFNSHEETLFPHFSQPSPFQRCFTSSLPTAPFAFQLLPPLSPLQPVLLFLPLSLPLPSLSVPLLFFSPNPLLLDSLSYNRSSFLLCPDRSAIAFPILAGLRTLRTSIGDHTLRTGLRARVGRSRSGGLRGLR